MLQSKHALWQLGEMIRICSDHPPRVCGQGSRQGENRDSLKQKHVVVVDRSWGEKTLILEDTYPPELGQGLRVCVLPEWGFGGENLHSGKGTPYCA